MPIITRHLTEISEKHKANFWAKIIKREDSDCWDWSGFKDKNGYPRMVVNKNPLRGNRISYLIHFGFLTPGKLILHSCDNPSCCNPSHLSEGSPKDNTDDRERRGRSAKGQKIKRSKLTEDQVKNIRDLRSKGASYSNLCDQFGVNITAVFSVVHHLTWKHVPSDVEKPKKAKWSPKTSMIQVHEIRRLKDVGHTLQQIADAVNLSKDHVWRITRGLRYPEV